MSTKFDPYKEKHALNAQTKAIRKRTYKKSRLDRYKGEILELHKINTHASEIQRWLKDHRINVVLSTVTRWLKKNAPVS